MDGGVWQVGWRMDGGVWQFGWRMDGGVWQVDWMEELHGLELCHVAPGSKIYIQH